MTHFKMFYQNLSGETEENNYAPLKQGFSNFYRPRATFTLSYRIDDVTLK